jgi:hypothetical protein
MSVEINPVHGACERKPLSADAAASDPQSVEACRQASKLFSC